MGEDTIDSKGIKILAFHIFNFRSISEGTIVMNEDKLISIIGQNETGKTTILQAIAFWGNDPSVKISEDDGWYDIEKDKIMSPYVITSVEFDIFKYLSADTLIQIGKEERETLDIQTY
ncbi:MAG: AAA family ATPase [Candidatus Heimdallarchaeota archaeon]|nr:AAA family ATPase [Candidatus Heimdallarchaeota archaeon]